MTQTPDRTTRASQPGLLLTGLLLSAVGVWLAVQQRWTCDDAYISFRYARNLVEGLGLVFNQGERVEGFTNLLWTLWVAVGLKLGFTPEGWTNFWSLSAYSVSLVLLLAFHGRLRRHLRDSRLRPFPLPLALILGVCHTEWRVWATSGLETSLITLVLLAAYLLATREPVTPWRSVQLGLLMGLGLSLRPDAAVAGAVIGGFVFVTAPDRWRAAFSYAAVLGAVGALLTLWRLSYYGDLFPNTYYAKSASSPQYGQGAAYLMLYFHRYWPLLLAALPLWSLRARLFGTRPDPARSWLRAGVGLAAALAACHMFYVARIGGDFMFARMLIPITPLLLILVELGLIDQPRENRLVKRLVAGCLVLGIVLTPSLPGGSRWVAGVADERAVYSPAHVARLDLEAETLSRFIQGLNVRFLMIGSEAILAYRARIPVAVDLHGLVDRFTARRPSTPGGRIGHNKFMPLSYAVSTRKLHFMLHDSWHTGQGVTEYIPRWPIRFGALEGLLLHWDASLMSELRARGAVFEDFPTFLDRYLQESRSAPAARMAEDFEKFKHFYFDHNDDPGRWAGFQALLATHPPGPPGSTGPPQ